MWSTMASSTRLSANHVRVQRCRPAGGARQATTIGLLVPVPLAILPARRPLPGQRGLQARGDTGLTHPMDRSSTGVQGLSHGARRPAAPTVTGIGCEQDPWAHVHYEDLEELPEQLRKKQSPTAHLPTSVQG